MEVEQRAEIKLRRLQQFDLTDVHVLKRVNALCSLLNFTSDHFGNQLGRQLRKRAAGCFPLNDLDHLPADSADLRTRGVSGFLDLVGSALREGDGKESEKVVVRGLDGDVGLEQCLPLSDKRAEFVRREIEPVEVGEAVLALHLIHSQLDLPERMVFILLQICQRNLEYPSLQCLVGIL